MSLKDLGQSFFAAAVRQAVGAYPEAPHVTFVSKVACAALMTDTCVDPNVVDAQTVLSYSKKTKFREKDRYIFQTIPLPGEVYSGDTARFVRPTFVGDLPDVGDDVFFTIVFGGKIGSVSLGGLTVLPTAASSHYGVCLPWGLRQSLVLEIPAGLTSIYGWIEVGTAPSKAMLAVDDPAALGTSAVLAQGVFYTRPARYVPVVPGTRLIDVIPVSYGRHSVLTFFASYAQLGNLIFRLPGGARLSVCVMAQNAEAPLRLVTDASENDVTVTSCQDGAYREGRVVAGPYARAAHI